MSEDSRGAASVEKKLKKKKKRVVQETPPDAVAKEAAADVDPVAKVKKVKKKKLGSSTAAPVEAAASVPDVEGERSKKRKKSVEPEAAETGTKVAPADDDERKDQQRQIQQLVVKLRAEGKSKHEIEAAKHDLKKGFGSCVRKPDNHKAKKKEAWMQRENEKAERRAKNDAAVKAKKAASEKPGDSKDEPAGQESEGTDTAVVTPKKSRDETRKEMFKAEADPWKEARKEGLEHKHDIVVIPVIWRGRHDHQEIEKAAADVKAALASSGLDVWVDSRRHYTPGQKFAHWEFRGVMLRIEIGPEDFDKGMMKLCKSKEAGDYKSVEKKHLRLPPRGSRKLLLQLKEWGLTKIDIERRPADDEESDEDEAPAGEKGADEDDDIGGNWKPRAVAEDPKAKKKKRRVA